MILKVTLRGGAKARNRRSAFCVTIMLNPEMEWEGIVWM